MVKCLLLWDWKISPRPVSEQSSPSSFHLFHCQWEYILNIWSHIIPTDQTFSLPDADRIVWPVARLSRLQVWCQQRTAEYLLWPQWSGMPGLRALTGELSSRARYWGKEQVPGTHSWLVSKITSCLERGGRISEDISLYFKFSGAFFLFWNRACSRYSDTDTVNILTTLDDLNSFPPEVETPGVWWWLDSLCWVTQCDRPQPMSGHIIVSFQSGDWPLSPRITLRKYSPNVRNITDIFHNCPPLLHKNFVDIYDKF